MTREEFFKDLPERAEAELASLVDQFNANAGQISSLVEQLERAKTNDILLNEKICLLCELLGVNSEMADQHVERRRRG